MTSLAKWMSAQKIAHGFFKDFILPRKA